jgi:hypothetical protein
MFRRRVVSLYASCATRIINFIATAFTPSPRRRKILEHATEEQMQATT